MDFGGLDDDGESENYFQSASRLYHRFVSKRRTRNASARDAPPERRREERRDFVHGEGLRLVPVSVASEKNVISKNCA